MYCGDVKHGVKIVFRKEGRVLAVRNDDGLNLPSAHLPYDEGTTGTDVRVCANGLYKIVTRRSAMDNSLVPVYRGSDDEHGISSSYVADAPDLKKVPPGTEWSDPRDVLLGKWGLFARDVFNKLGIMNRPALSLERVYRVSEKALNSRSASVTEAIDMVIDEVALLADIRKPWAIDSILRKVDLMRVHPDVIATMKAVVEEIPDLPSKAAFNRAAQVRLDAVDGGRVKIRFGEHGDVRAAALSIYRKTGKEFGDALRAGTLSQRFPHMRSVAAAEATMRESPGEASSPWPSSLSTVPVEQWPEDQRAAASNRGPRKDETSVDADGIRRDPRGVYLDPHRPSRTVYEPTGDFLPDIPFRKALDEAPESAVSGRLDITFEDDDPN